MTKPSPKTLPEELPDHARIDLNDPNLTGREAVEKALAEQAADPVGGDVEKA